MKHAKRIGAGLLVMAVFCVPYLIPHFAWIFAVVSVSAAMIGIAYLVGSTLVD